MMRHLAWILALGCLGLGVGCGRPKPPAASETTPAGVPPSSPTSAPGPGTKDSAAVSPTSNGNSVVPPAAPVTAPHGDQIVNPKKQTVKGGQVGRMPVEGWKPSKLTPLDIATKIDATFKNLNGAAANMVLHSLLPIGTMTMKTEGKFAGNDWSVNFPVVEGDPPHPVREGVIENHGRMTEFRPRGGSGAYSPPHDFKVGGSLNGPDVLAKWPTDMPRLAMSHFITGKDAFVPLVRALQAPGSGFTVVSEERTSSVDGKYFSYYQIHARRIDPKTKALRAEYEIRVESTHFLPVTMVTHVMPQGKNAIIQEWAGRWSDLKKNSSDFKLPN